MIFVTVGAQMAFPRLVDAVEQWARVRQDEDVLAQIGPADHVPTHIRWVRFIDPAAFRSTVQSARLVVGHAGMGTILTSLYFQKPLLVMPRRGDLMETRNDHQVATARRFAASHNIAVAMEVEGLVDWLNCLNIEQKSSDIGLHASNELLIAIETFVNQDLLLAPKPTILSPE